MKKRIFLLAAVAAIVVSCGGKASGGMPAEPETRHFTLPELPVMYKSPELALEYMLGHYWDAYFAGNGVTDTSTVLGVRRDELEKAAADYVKMLESAPMDAAQKSVSDLFDRICAAQRADTASHVYLLLTELFSKYLYDPNSPVRNEDYYLPFVTAMAASDLTAEQMRPAYEYEAKMCSLNRYGTQVPDFKFTTPDGRVRSLYGVRAAWTVLFFSNPGCTACREILDALVSVPGIDAMIASGKVAVVNIYIDRELDKWREYLSNYPSNWICGYDHRFIIRDDVLFNVRAIPSLYLLDSDKRVVYKDAPTDKVTNKLSNL